MYSLLLESMNVIPLFMVPLLIAIGVTTSTYCPAQVRPLTIGQADSCMQQEAKPLLILLSTDWCRYCRMQKNQLQKNKDFVYALSKFYFAEFNAESQETVRFREKDWQYKPTGASVGFHTLAEELAGGEEVAYPAWVLLDKAYQPVFRYSGILTPEQLNMLLEAIEIISNAE